MHAFVTGASAGIGEAIARQLASEGYDLTLVARRVDQLERVAAELEGVQTRVVAADLTKLDTLAGLIREAEAALGPIDVLVNNAGMQIVARTPNVTPEAAERLMTLDLFAPLRLTQAVLPGMIARRAGTIVDIASLAALAPTPGMAHYSAAKAGLAAASEALRPELKAQGVHVVTVYPGPVQTRMADAAVDRYDVDPLRGMPIGTAQGLARQIGAAIRRRRKRVIYPAAYRLAWHFQGLTNWVVGLASPLPTE